VIAENIEGHCRVWPTPVCSRFKGAEIGGRLRFTKDFRVRGNVRLPRRALYPTYARLRPDGSIQQLGGNRLELSPQNLGAVGLLYTPTRGFNAEVVRNYVGSVI
jgi:outer membrane receptor protein involved in Fe transport